MPKKTTLPNKNDLIASVFGSLIIFISFMVRGEIIGKEPEIILAAAMSIGPISFFMFTIISDGLNCNAVISLKSWVKEIPMTIIIGFFYTVIILFLITMIGSLVIGYEGVNIKPFTLISIHFVPHILMVFRKYLI
jgi:hypothetical protein